MTLFMIPIPRKGQHDVNKNQKRKEKFSSNFLQFMTFYDKARIVMTNYDLCPKTEIFILFI